MCGPDHLIMHQLPLAIQCNEEATFANFYWENNALIEQQIQLAIQGIGERFIYLWGRESSGKSHLLQACCHALGINHQVSYLPLTLFSTTGPEILEGLNDYAFIGLDDIDAVAGIYAWEVALFNLYNYIRDCNRCTLIITSKCPPMQLHLKLNDLKSRLSSGLTLQINALTDHGKIKMLQIHAHKRGFNLPDNVGKYLIQRYTRNLPELLILLDQLDAASLAAQRKITIPFVKEILLSNNPMIEL